VEEDLTTRAGVTHSAWLMATAAVIWRSSACLMTRKLSVLHQNHQEPYCSVCLVAVLGGVVEGLIMTAGVTMLALTTTMLTVAVTWMLCVERRRCTRCLGLLTIPLNLHPHQCAGTVVAVLGCVGEDLTRPAGVITSVRRMVIAAVTKKMNVMLSQCQVQRVMSPLQRGMCPAQRSMSSAQRGMSPLQRGMCPAQRGMSPSQRAMFPVLKELCCPAHEEPCLRWMSVCQAVLLTLLVPDTIPAVCSHSCTRVRSTTPVWRWLEGRPGAAPWWTVRGSSSTMSGDTATPAVSSDHQLLQLRFLQCPRREDPLIIQLLTLQSL